MERVLTKESLEWQVELDWITQGYSLYWNLQYSVKSLFTRVLLWMLWIIACPLKMLYGFIVICTNHVVSLPIRHGYSTTLRNGPIAAFITRMYSVKNYARRKLNTLVRFWSTAKGPLAYCVLGIIFGMILSFTALYAIGVYNQDEIHIHIPGDLGGNVVGIAFGLANLHGANVFKLPYQSRSEARLMILRDLGIGELPWNQRPYDPGGIVKPYVSDPDINGCIYGAQWSGVVCGMYHRAGNAVHEPERVFLDSGAANHYFNAAKCLEFMFNLKQITNTFVYTAGKDKLVASHRGQLGDISGVIAVRDLQMSLISIGQLLRTDVFDKVEFTSTEIYGVKDESYTCIGTYKDGMPIAKLSAFGLDKVEFHREQWNARVAADRGKISLACAAVYAAMSDAPVSNLDLIHSRLMGVAKSTLMKMISKRLMADLPTLNTVRQADCFCEHCIAAKMCKLKYDKKSKRTATEPLELVHFDVFGDIKPHGLRGERYVLVIVDDYTRMVWAIPMNKKSEMNKRFQEWQLMAETKMSRLFKRAVRVKLKATRNDGAGENISKKLRDYLLANHIDQEMIVPGCSPQNGVAERAIGVLTSMVRHCLHRQDLPLSFWSEAYRNAAVVRNYLPCTANPESQSPWFRLTGSKPSWKGLRTFGAEVYSWMPYSAAEYHHHEMNHDTRGQPLSPKLLSRAEKGIYVGPSPLSNGHRVYFPHRGRVLVRRHVVFDERPRPYVHALHKDFLPDNPANTRKSFVADQQKFLGRRVNKQFKVDGKLKWFSGRVVDINSDRHSGDIIYGISYLDGDGEDLTREELLDILQEENAAEMIEQQVTFGNDSDSDDESEAGLDVSDTSDTSADKESKDSDVDKESKDSQADNEATQADDEAKQADGDDNDSSSTSSEEEQVSGGPRRSTRRRKSLKRFSPASFMAYFGKGLFALAATFLPSTAIDSGCVHRPYALHSSIPYIHEDRLARTEEILNISSDKTVMGVDWAYVLDEHGEFESLYAKQVPLPDESILGNNAALAAWKNQMDGELLNDKGEGACAYTCSPAPSYWIYPSTLSGNNLVKQYAFAMRPVETIEAAAIPHDSGIIHAALIAAAGYFGGVMARDVNEPKNMQEALNDPIYGHEWKRAVDAEISNMTDGEVWEVSRCPSPRPRCVDTVWVWKVKSKKDGTVDKLKARLCCRGFTQIYGQDYNETFAPVVRAASLRFQLADAVRRKLHLDQIDFAAAFLQSPIDGDVYLKPPPGINVPKGFLLKLKKGMYGLKQAAHLWAKELSTLLKELGFRQCVADPCLWVYDDGQGYITISTWVDDCIVAYNDAAIWKQLFDKMAMKYPISAKGRLDFCLGMAVRQNSNRTVVELDQSKYVDDMCAKFPNQLRGKDLFAGKYRIPAVHGQKYEKALLPEGSEPLVDSRYRELLGKLTYLASWTRPDISTIVSMLARHQNEPHAIHWKALVHVLVYCKMTKEKCIRFSAPDGASDDHLNLLGYVDADYAGCVDTSRSRTGFLFMCCGAPIVWRTVLQPIVAQSTMESEYVAANACAREAEWCRLLYDDILGGNVGVDHSMPVALYEDNESCIALAKNFMISKRSRHIRIRFHYVRQQIRDGVIVLEKIKGTENPADAFTKVLAENLFSKYQNVLVRPPIVPKNDL